MDNLGGTAVTVALAGFGASITLIGLVISKENKVSEFRQQWIDGLRQDISTFISLAHAMRFVGNKDVKEQRLKLDEIATRIRLRFKKDDPEAVVFRKRCHS